MTSELLLITKSLSNYTIMVHSMQLMTFMMQHTYLTRHRRWSWSSRLQGYSCRWTVWKQTHMDTSQSQTPARSWWRGWLIIFHIYNSIAVTVISLQGVLWLYCRIWTTSLNIVPNLYVCRLEPWYTKWRALCMKIIIPCFGGMESGPQGPGMKERKSWLQAGLEWRPDAFTYEAIHSHYIHHGRWCSNCAVYDYQNSHQLIGSWERGYI